MYYCTDRYFPPLTAQAWDTLGTIKVEDFLKFLNTELLGNFKTNIRDEYTSLIKPLQEEVQKLKTELGTIKTKLSSAQTEITELNSKLKTLHSNCEDEKKVTADNLKYLINHDRNYRQQNLIILGVPEIPTLGNVEFESDNHVVNHLLEMVGVDEEVALLEVFRLGKKPVAVDDEDEDGGRPRPIKVRLSDKYSVSTAIKNSKNLKDQFGQLKIFIEPDKTKKERDEYSRLGKNKKDLMEKYPTPEGGQPRVILNKGKLLVDGAEVDHFRSIQSLF